MIAVPALTFQKIIQENLWMELSKLVILPEASAIIRITVNIKLDHEELNNRTGLHIVGAPEPRNGMMNL